MKNKSIIGSALIIIALIIVYFSTDILRSIPNVSAYLPENIYLRTLLLRTWDYLPVFIVAIILFPKQISKLLGLQHSILKSMLFAFIFCIPFIAIFILFYDFNSSIQFSTIFKNAITPSIYEEIAYRALVFGGLYYVFNWKFFPAVFINALIFGMAHLYQANDPLNALFIFLITFVGSIWFSWIYMKWDKNLFIIIFLHMFMNSAYELFDGSSGAAGEVLSNIGRFSTILLSIILTLKLTGDKSLSLSNFKETPKRKHKEFEIKNAN